MKKSIKTQTWTSRYKGWLIVARWVTLHDQTAARADARKIGKGSLDCYGKDIKDATRQAKLLIDRAEPAFNPEKSHPDMTLGKPVTWMGIKAVERPMKQHNPPSRYEVWHKLGFVEAESQTSAKTKAMELLRANYPVTYWSNPDETEVRAAATKVKP